MFSLIILININMLRLKKVFYIYFFKKNTINELFLGHLIKMNENYP